MSLNIKTKTRQGEATAAAETQPSEAAKADAAAGAIPTTEGPAAEAATSQDAAGEEAAATTQDAAAGEAATSQDAAAEEASKTAEAAQAGKGAVAFSEDSRLIVRGYASKFLEPDELRISIYFQQQSNILQGGLADLKQRSEAFRKKLTDLGIKNEHILDQSNVDGGLIMNQNMMIPPFLRGNIINANQPWTSTNFAGMDFGFFQRGSDMYRFSAVFLVTLKDINLAKQLIEASTQANGFIQDVFFTISDEKAAKEKAALLEVALADAVQQANKFSSDAGFSVQNVNNMNVVDFSLNNNRMWMNLEVEFLTK